MFKETIRFDCIELPMIEGATDCHALYSVVLENSTITNIESEDNEEEEEVEEFSNALTEE